MLANRAISLACPRRYGLSLSLSLSGFSFGAGFLSIFFGGLSALGFAGAPSVAGGRCASVEAGGRVTVGLSVSAGLGVVAGGLVVAGRSLDVYKRQVWRCAAQFDRRPLRSFVERFVRQELSLRPARSPAPARCALGNAERIEHSELHGTLDAIRIHNFRARDIGGIHAHDGHLDSDELLMRSMAQRFLAALLAVGVSALPAMPQSQQRSAPAPTAVPAPPPPPADSTRPPNQAPPLRTTSDLVRIDVEVTDRSGASMKGLRADQFTVCLLYTSRCV